ncbi:MAG TPA: GPR endopeptidase, partial [Peptococcaceae bacterium]|nr:GPR endopeptidase [Peptococcaceae bacterium]
AIGVPTVVNAALIAKLALDTYFEKFSQGQYHPVYIQETVRDVIEPFQGQLVVTPREIDDLIQNAAQTINRGITMAVHQRIPEDELEALI